MITNIALSNMEAKFYDDYEDLSLKTVLLNTDIYYFANFVEEQLSYFEAVSEDGRIDLRFDHGVLAKYNLPFDEFTISLYREGWELQKGHTSNYMYNEFDGLRCMWVDLYYSPEEYDFDEVARDIMKEINNLCFRDLTKYLNELKDEEDD